MTDLTDMATPATGVRMSRTIKVQRDYGVRRWLADTGCGHDLVQTSLVLKGGGKAYIRMRAPKYLNTANELTSITKEMTMYIPQLDEMAEMLCCQNTPAVIIIGERCVEHQFFIKPDGTRITMDAAGDIPYLTGGSNDAACVGGEEEGPNTDDEDPNLPDMARDPASGQLIRPKKTSSGQTSVVQDDAVPHGEAPLQQEARDRGNEVESLNPYRRVSSHQLPTMGIDLLFKTLVAWELGVLETSRIQFAKH
jgi:hypothetical protein